MGVSHRAGLLQDGKLPRLKKALFADSSAIVAGAALGTSSTTPYIESSAGVAAGGRTGLTAVIVGLLVYCLFIPSAARAIGTWFCNSTCLVICGCIDDSGHCAY